MSKTLEGKHSPWPLLRAWQILPMCWWTRWPGYMQGWWGESSYMRTRWLSSPGRILIMCHNIYPYDGIPGWYRVLGYRLWGGGGASCLHWCCCCCLLGGSSCKDRTRGDSLTIVVYRFVVSTGMRILLQLLGFHLASALENDVKTFPRYSVINFSHN